MGRIEIELSPGPWPVTRLTIVLFAIVALACLAMAFELGLYFGRRFGVEMCSQKVIRIDRTLDVMYEASAALIACEEFLRPMRPDHFVRVPSIARGPVDGVCSNCGGGVDAK